MASVSDLSWRETSFFAKLQLFFKSIKLEKEKMCSSDRLVQAAGYSALSSTYYSIVSTAFAQLKAASRPKLLAPVKVAVWCLTWLPLAVYCYWRMLPLSNRVVDIISYYRMSADQCDIRQSILRCRGRYEAAKTCIFFALQKHPEKAHTRGLLHAGLGEIYRQEINQRFTRIEIKAALAEAEEAAKYDSRQAARIYSHCADLVDFVEEGYLGPGIELRRKARELAQATGTGDQLLKL